MIMTHCLTFDVEEHFQVSAFDSPMRRRHWDRFESRVERNTWKILELLEAQHVRATFFILGWVAERHPDLVRTIARGDHEVASHGYAHELITSKTRETFREDVRRAKEILEDLIGAPVLGYRAPSFTITSRTTWALPILVQEGYLYDSSIFPIWHDRYGFLGAHSSFHRIVTKAGSLWELPPSTIALLGVRIPIAGGGYARVLPYCVLRRLLRIVESQKQQLVLYFHPWELDPDQPRMRGPLLSRFRHYINLSQTEEKLAGLLQDFRFGPIRDAVAVIHELGERPGASFHWDASPHEYETEHRGVGVLGAGCEADLTGLPAPISQIQDTRT